MPLPYTYIIIILTFFSDESYNPHPLCLVVYYIPSGYSPIIASHGNSKSTQPYFLTLPSTTMDIKKKCVSSGPKEVVSNIESSAGSILDATYPGQLPRNEQQISNFKRRTPVSTGQKLSCQGKSNELYSIMLQAQLEEGSEKFIRDVKAYPKPAIVLASEQQLLDLEHFCCNAAHYSILTVDPTFSLGDFDVTPTTYRHLLLCSKRTSKPPVILGPTMIHYRKNFGTYKFLASCMIAQNRSLVALQAFGTDGEKPLFDAFLHEFKFAVHLTCFNDVRRNIKERLHDLNLPDAVQTEILNDIFRRKVGSTQLMGLVNQSSFEEKFGTLISKWKQNDTSDYGPVSLFCAWFRTNKEEVIIRATMLLPVRKEAGLGSPPEPFYTNSSECINNVLKVKVDYKRTELTLFVDKLRQLVQDQQREVEKAIIGCGKYCLQSQYSNLGVHQGQWFTMNKEQRKRCLRKFNVMPVTSIDHGPSTSNSVGPTDIDHGPSTSHSVVPTDIDHGPSTSHSVVPTDIDHGPSTSHSVVPTDIASSPDDSPGPPSTLDPATINYSSQSVSQPPQGMVLSTKLSSLSGKLGLPVAAIDGIARKAVEILSTEGAIVKAPGFSTEAKMVVSRSGRRPHLIQPKRKSGGLMCDEDCPQYKSAKICSHTVATAEYNKQLDQFVASHNSVKKMPNLTKFATTNMPKGRGRKGSKGPVKRKRPIPGEKRIELNPPASKSPVGVEVQISPSISTVYQPSISAPVSATIGGSPLFPGMYTPCTSTSFPAMPPATAFSPSASPYPPPFLSPSYMHPFPTSLSPYCGLDQTNVGAYPFRVHLITGNISVCHGCKGRYDKKLGPPNNICLQHEEWRTFTPPGSSEKQSRFANVYYHCNVSCVMAVWPTFIYSCCPNRNAIKIATRA